MAVVDLHDHAPGREPERRHAGGAPDGFTRQVCAAYQGWRYEDLPEAVRRAVRLFVLDTLGVIGGAAEAPGIPIINGRLSAWEKDGPSTALVGKWRASPPTAALANGAAAHALDFDDMHDPARIHAFCVNLPAVLAAAEERSATHGPVSGRDLIAALATGVEFHGRMGMACYDSLGRGWHPTPVLGLMGATLGVGRVLGLEGDTLVNAFGLGYHQVAGSRQPMFDGDLAKRTGPGFAARSAVLAAYLAMDGLTGPSQALEGQAGYLHMYEQDEAEPHLLLDRLHDHWEILELAVKPYPCCRCTHSLIPMGLDLRAEGIPADRIEHADLYLGRTNWRVVGQQPYDPSRDSVVHAQFNAAYCFARAVVHGTVDLASFQRPQIADSAVAALAARCAMHVDPEIPATAMEPARIEIRLRDGTTISRRRDAMKGAPGDPMSESETVDKFAGCLANGLGTGRDEAERLAALVLDLDSVDDVSEIVRAFPGNRR